MPPESAALHVPVLEEELLAWLQPRAQGLYVDGTLGLGGHAQAILRASAPDGRVVGFEWDEDAALMAQERLADYGDRFQLVRSSYADMVPALRLLGIQSIDGLVIDLGVSSLQLDREDRGFSFRGDSPLDMRMDRRRSTTAAMLVERLSESQLADVFYHYGEERQARRVASFLVKAREVEPVTTTARLAALVAEAIPARFHPPKVHVATKVFQALRIAVNGELDNLTKLLAEAPGILASGARIGIVTFHSLEDRIVKQSFNRNGAYAVVTKKPVVPTQAEVHRNPRARSAKLRVAERT